MITHLLDTNICIYIIKKSPAEVFQKFRTFNPGSIGVSAITVAELMYGASKSTFPERNRKALEEFLRPLEIVDFNYEATLRYSPIRNTLEKKGTPIGALDTLIAAHAQSLNAILVSNNLKEFNRVEGLITENWLTLTTL